MDSRISSFSSANAAGAGHDLRPTWAKSASGHTAATSCPSSQFATPTESVPRVITKQNANQDLAVQQQRCSSERDFPSLETAANAKFQGVKIHSKEKIVYFYLLGWKKESRDGRLISSYPFDSSTKTDRLHWRICSKAECCSQITRSLLWWWPICCFEFFTEIRHPTAYFKTFIRKGANKERFLSAATNTKRFFQKNFNLIKSPILESVEAVDDNLPTQQSVKEESTIISEETGEVAATDFQSGIVPSTTVQQQVQNPPQQPITSTAFHQSAEAELGDLQNLQQYTIPPLNAPPPTLEHQHLQQMQQTFQLPPHVSSILGHPKQNCTQLQILKKMDQRQDQQGYQIPQSQQLEGTFLHMQIFLLSFL